MKVVRWIGAHIASPSWPTVGEADFWATVTGSNLVWGNEFGGSRRLEQNTARQSVELQPGTGDAYLFRHFGTFDGTERYDTFHGDATVFLELFAKNPSALADVARQAGGRWLSLRDDTGRDVSVAAVAGAQEVASAPTSVALRSPAGLVWRASLWRGQRTVPAPAQFTPPLFEGRQVRGRVDQITIDIPPRHFDDEVEFWAHLLGWTVIDTALPDFVMLYRRGMPLRLMIRRDRFAEPGDTPQAHIDVAGGGAADVDRLVAWHTSLGAHQGMRHPWWITMTDPEGREYCLTRRDPVTGRIQAR